MNCQVPCKRPIILHFSLFANTKSHKNPSRSTSTEIYLLKWQLSALNCKKWPWTLVVTIIAYLLRLHPLPLCSSTLVPSILVTSSQARIEAIPFLDLLQWTTPSFGLRSKGTLFGFMYPYLIRVQTSLWHMSDTTKRKKELPLTRYWLTLDTLSANRGCANLPISSKSPP